MGFELGDAPRHRNLAELIETAVTQNIAPFFLYDVATLYPGEREKDFFQRQDWQRTNMYLPGQFPDPVALEVWGVHFGVMVNPQYNAEGVERFLRDNGKFQFDISDRRIADEHLSCTLPYSPNPRRLRRQARLMRYGLNFRGSVVVLPKIYFGVKCAWWVDVEKPVTVAFALSGWRFRPTL